MRIQPAAFLRTTLPLAIETVEQLDSERYHSIWLPDHMVSFWPDSIWTPEFTDLAIASPSPHRHLDALAVAGAAAVLTQNIPLATHVIDTVRRHPAMLAQSALTISHLSKGRFFLGLGSGETENTVPYGFDFEKPVGRFEEALKVIKLLWETDGFVNFDGQFYQLHDARLDTEPYDGKFPPIWIGASGPRMLKITGRYADGWWPAGAWTPEDYAAKLAVVRESADAAGRDPLAITPATSMLCLIGEEDEVAEMLTRPMVKSIAIMLTAEEMRRFGHEHPLGPDWRGYQDINPAVLNRERVVRFVEEFDSRALRDIVPMGTPRQVAEKLSGFVDAGMRVIKIMDYGGMAGVKFAATSAAKVRETEDLLMAMCND
ncbi:MAG: LLM class flavin-dependent oxidoreductase [Novosphingobium sp.]|nr:LLM class flavin-dependent oxidoreductase [Novosphingobium sp.]